LKAFSVFTNIAQRLLGIVQFAAIQSWYAAAAELQGTNDQASKITFTKK